jgi:mRNA-degrading endonuclease RelE of RelBE toxin-antitoxin system
MYKVFSHKKAVKYYESLDEKTAKRINKAIEAMSRNPLEGLHIKRLREHKKENTDLQ